MAPVVGILVASQLAVVLPSLGYPRIKVLPTSTVTYLLTYCLIELPAPSSRDALLTQRSGAEYG